MPNMNISFDGGVAQLASDEIDEMVSRKHDLEFQLHLCRQIMARDAILPFPFERAVVLLRKAKRLDEELEICRYVKSYCDEAERSWGGESAMIWKSPKLQKCVARIEKLEAMIKPPA